MSIARLVGRNTLHTVLARLAVLGVWFLVTPLVLFRLGPERFGFWSILLVLGGSLVSVDLGLGVAVTRFVARLHAEGRARELRSLLVRSLALQLAVAAILSTILLLAAPAILAAFHVPAEWSAEARVALHFAVATFAITAAANLFLAGLQGLQRMDRALAVAAPAAAGLGIGIVLATGRERPLVALMQVQCAYAVVIALAFGLALFGLVRAGERRAEAPLRAGGRDVPLRELLVLGGYVQVNALLGLVQANVDKVLLGTLIALAPVAAYELGARATLAALLPPVLFLGALLPAFSRHAQEADPGSHVALYRAALEPHFAMSFGIAGALVALAPWILSAWLGEPPADATLFLVALAVTQAGNLATGVSSTVARVGGVAHLETAFAVLGTGLHVALSLVGLRLFGVRGLLLGTVASSLVAAAWFVRRIESWLGAESRGSAASAAAPFLGAALVAGILAYLVAQALAPARDAAGSGRALVAGAATYAVAFLGALRFGRPAVWRSLVERTRRVTGLAP